MLRAPIRSVLSLVSCGLLLGGGLLFGACARDAAITDSSAGAAPPGPPSAVAAAGAPQRFGAPLTASKPVALDTVLAEPDKYKGAVKVEGQVTSVCTKKGCWMALKGQKVPQTVRVSFKDYGFFVPTATREGTVATCEGELQVKTVSEDDARHYARETKGVSREQVLAIRGPQRELSFVARGVELRNN